MELFLKDALLNLPFRINLFASAFPGSVVLGKVVVQEGMCVFVKDSTFIVDYGKLTEFHELLEILGKNVLIETGDADDIEFDSKNMEIGREESIEVNCSSLVRKIKEIETGKIDFDQFSYLHFIAAIRNVSLFIINPSREEFRLMKKFERTDPSLCVKDAIVEVAVPEPEPLEKRNEYEQFHLEMFLSTHISLLRFCRNLKKLA